MTRRLLNSAVVQIGYQAHQSQGQGFATPWGGMAESWPQRVGMHGWRDE